MAYVPRSRDLSPSAQLNAVLKTFTFPEGKAQYLAEYVWNYLAEKGYNVGALNDQAKKDHVSFAQVYYFGPRSEDTSKGDEFLNSPSGSIYLTGDQKRPSYGRHVSSNTFTRVIILETASARSEREQAAALEGYMKRYVEGAYSIDTHTRMQKSLPLNYLFQDLLEMAFPEHYYNTASEKETAYAQKVATLMSNLTHLKITEKGASISIAEAFLKHCQDLLNRHNDSRHITTLTPDSLANLTSLITATEKGLEETNFKATSGVSATQSASPLPESGAGAGAGAGRAPTDVYPAATAPTLPESGAGAGAGSAASIAVTAPSKPKRSFDDLFSGYRSAVHVDSTKTENRALRSQLSQAYLPKVLKPLQTAITDKTVTNIEALKSAVLATTESHVLEVYKTIDQDLRRTLGLAARSYQTDKEAFTKHSSAPSPAMATPLRDASSVSSTQDAATGAVPGSDMA